MQYRTMKQSLPFNNNHGHYGNKSKPSFLVVFAVMAMSAWALLESSSTIDTYTTKNHDDANLDHSGRSLSEAVGNASLASDAVDASSSTSEAEQPLHKFIVISQQRSGTAFFASLFDKHSHIRCSHEDLFYRLGLWGMKTLIEAGSVEAYMEEIHRSMDALSLQARNITGGNVTHVGFEIMYDQGVLAFNKDLFRELNEEGVKIIHLVRKNVLLKYISKETNDIDRKNPVKRFHQAHPESEGEVQALQSIKIGGQVYRMLQYFREQSDQNKYVDDLLTAEFGDDGFHTMYYEDLNNDNQGEMNRIFDFLELEHEKVESQFTKIHKGKHASEYFSEKNKERVEGVIRNSEFAFVLEPDLPSYPGW
mmetsp:Transcript_19624/g.38802  ORF Transcript_19624/g.38802 Transcript_19624/m.38802 type:complete len:364 (-) Transcript_19624:135-1226(-)